MRSYWECSAVLFPNATKVVKKIKKAKTYAVYDADLEEILIGEEIFGCQYL